MDSEIEQKLARIEHAICGLSENAIHIQRQINKAHIRNAVFDQALLIEVANALAKAPADEALEYRSNFVGCFMRKCADIALSGESWGGTEQSEAEYMEYAKATAESYVRQVAYLEAEIRSIRAQNAPAA